MTVFKHLRVPKESELHHWADYVELKCLTDQDLSFSAERLLSQVNLAGDLQEASIDAQDGSIGDLMDMVIDGESEADVGLENFADSKESGVNADLESEGEAAPAAAVESQAELDGPRSSSDAGSERDWRAFGREAERADNRDLWSRRIFLLLADRANSLGDVYPFDVDPLTLTITRKGQTDSRLKYVFYLTCASLSRFRKQDQSRLTSSFEVASAAVLRDMLPVSYEIDLFGTARGGGGSRFAGSLYERIEQLAAVLRGSVTCDAGDFHPNDSADNGLDIAAWLPMDDSGKGVPAFFCQCACGVKWEGKQYEANYVRWRSFIDLASPPTAVTLIPHYFRKWGEKWYVPADVSEFLIDRLRALRLSQAPLGEDASQIAQVAWDYRDVTV